MTIVMFACSEKAYLLMEELKKRRMEACPEDEMILFTKCGALEEISSHRGITELTGEWFEKADAFVFLCAAGIAVRSIAPYLKHKSADPAVLVIDEAGRFCIPLLSGHAGGANELAGQFSELLRDRGTVPVITTATDTEGKFAVDDFARRNRLLLKEGDKSSWRLAKNISAKILQGETVRLFSDLPVFGKAPEGLEYPPQTRKEASPFCIRISFRREDETLKNQLQLIPRILVVGIGCRKGVSREQIGLAVDRCFQEEGLLTEAIAAVASIDLKKQEAGIIAYCEQKKLPFWVYSKEELAQAEGTFKASSFVKEITGVDNVCERSAALGALYWSGIQAGGGQEAAGSEKNKEHAVRLIAGKKCYNKVTVAVAAASAELYF